MLAHFRALISGEHNTHMGTLVTWRPLKPVSGGEGKMSPDQVTAIEQNQGHVVNIASINLYGAYCTV